MSEAAPVNDLAALTRHIETRYHVRHREQLPELTALATQVETVHADDPAAPNGLSGLLRKLIGELEVHMKKEELLLFPAIRRGRAPYSMLRPCWRRSWACAMPLAKTIVMSIFPSITA